MLKVKGLFLSMLLAVPFIAAPSFSYAEEIELPNTGLDPSEDLTENKDYTIPTAVELSSIVPFISDPGGWQSRGKYSGKIYPDTATLIPLNHGTYWKSGGGNFELSFTGVDGSFTAQLWEYDPGSGNDDVASQKFRVNYNSKWKIPGISKLLDGDNNEAELYVKITNAYNPETIYVEGFD